MQTSANISATSTLSFWKFVFREKTNRRLLLIASAATIAEFIVFKLCYPFPDFFSDSYSYLFAAYAHLDVSIWPIGYSKFLSFFHYLTYSSTALISFQYFLLEISALLFFFTYLYLFQPGKTVRILLYLFLFFNPLFLYLSNYINSDPIFAALSLFWFTQLMWIIYHPKPYQIIVQAVLLFLCFTIRNNAYYYPLIAALAFFLSTQSWKLKVLGIILPFVFLVPFIIHTENVAYKMTGARQYSLFTGWQLANNALYMRGHIQVDSTELPSKETRILNNLAEKYFSHRAPEFDNYLSAYVANYFLRQPNAPLKVFFSRYFHPKDDYSNVIAWGQASIIYGQYGSYLIKTHPFEFLRYYLLRNTKNYFIPPLEKLEIYNLGMDEVEPIAQYWFHFNTRTVSVVSKEAQGKLLSLYPLFFCFINLMFLANLIWAFVNKLNPKSEHIYRCLLILVAGFWGINFAFSTFATINVFRYQFFPLLVYYTFSLLAMEQIDKTELKIPYNKSYARQY